MIPKMYCMYIWLDRYIKTWVNTGQIITVVNINDVYTEKYMTLCVKIKYDIVYGIHIYMWFNNFEHNNLSRSLSFKYKVFLC